ncbi:beta strand repeat-containing protein, partial [Legionella quateirensis]
TLSDTDNIAITVNPVVDIANDAITLNEDTVANYDVNNNDTFENAGHTITAINGTAIAVGGTVGVANGTVLLNANGTLSFTPTANYNGSTSFTYTVTSGGVTETATVNVTVNPVNDAPINSVPGAQTTNEDTVRVFSSANGNAISLTDIDSASVTTTISVAHGSLTALATAGVTITNNGTGTVTLVGSPTNITTALNGLSYTPVADYNGADSLTIVTSDGALSDTDNIAITVNPVVDIANDAITLNEDTVANYDVNNNDTFENAGHTITAINGTAIAVGGTVAVANGTVLLNANGTLSFTPAANYNGSTSFTYTVTSGGVTETATVNVTVNPVNDAPINSVPGAQTTNEDTAQVFSSANGNAISLTDIDSASVTTTISVAHGSLTALATAGVTITNNGTGTVTLVGSPTNITTALNGLSYTPVADYNGADSLTVVTSDGTLSDTDNIAITVTPVVDIANDAITLNEDTVANYDVNNNDTFENAGHTITAINGTAIAVGGIVAVANGTVLLNANGTLSFTPTANYNGATSFTYTVTSGGVTETATVNVTVNPVNDAPINSVPGAQTMNEDATRIFSSANGNAISLTDIDSASVTTTISVAHGSLTALATAGVTITNNGTGTVTLVGSPANITIALNGLSYTPIADYNGPDSLTVVTNDGALSDTDSIVITVMPVADIVNDAVTTNEDTAVTINVNANDSFENAGHTITAINGTAIAVGGTVAVANGTVLLNANGTLSFTPTANYNGSTSFNYTVTSGGVTETATVNVTVNSVNDSPVNTISAQSTTEDTAVKLTGLSIVDVDAFGSTVSVTLAVASGVLTAATAGGVTVSGSGTSSVVLSGTVDNINAFLAGSSGVTYIPVANFSGSVNLTMTTNDLGNTGSGGALSDVDTVAINLTAVADAPMLSLPLTISTVNPGNTSISTEPGIVQTNLESELSLASGSLDTFNPPAGVTLNHSGNVNVFDGKLTNANYSLANGGQVSFGWQFVNGENIASEINSGYNDMAILVVTKPDGTKEMIQVTSSEQAGVSATVNGTYTYTATQAGNYQFSWLVTNGIDNNKDSQLNITSTTISYNSTAYGKPIAIPINAALKDPDGSETLTVRISGVPAGGVLSAGTLIAGVWEFTNMADLVGLIYYPPTSFTSGSINLTVTATATESSNGSTASTSQVLTISTDVTTNTISTGTEAGTVISGASGSVNDLIHAYAGNDTVNAGGGNDLVYGGAGNDTLNGEAGNDTIYGGIGNDIISGGDGNDLLFGQAGDDTLTGNAGNDILYGGTGIDNLNGGLGNDYMIGGQGADTLTGGGGIDTFVWLAGDNLGGTVASPIQDVITDFKPNPVGGGSPDVSVLNLSDLLLGENTANLDSYLNISKSGADTLIKIDPTGTNPVTNATQTIVLQGVDLTSVYGTINSHDIISNLITNGNLITD